MSGNVYLVGMPGTGKSEVGRLLAERLERPFADLDQEIEAETGRTVADIFAQEGERGFRARETAALSRISTRHRLVVACGGGIVTVPDNRALLRASGTVVWLKAPADVLAERVELDGTRPMVRDAGDLERLLKEREPLYEEAADLVVDATVRPDEVAGTLAEKLS